MTDRDAFIRRICENPADDTVRLVFADFLEENGEPERAEFIRVQCWLADYEKATGSGLTDGPNHNRIRELWRWHSPGLFANRDCLGPVDSATPCRGTLADENRILGHYSTTRGFVSHIELPTQAFLTHAKDIFATHPVTSVRLTDRDPYDVTDDDSWSGLSMWQGHELDGTCYPFRVPWELYLIMRSDEWHVRRGNVSNCPRCENLYYPDNATARHAICVACVTFARNLNNLPPL